MNANDFQRISMRTMPLAPADDRLVNAALGLCGEAGEFADALKKSRFQGHALDADALAGELGDILWYVALACDALGVTMGDVMEGNVAKLHRRYPEGFSPERSVNRGSMEC